MRASTGPKLPEVARGQRSGSERPDNGLYIFGLSERNKIKILLRSQPEYDIIHTDTKLRSGVMKKYILLLIVILLYGCTTNTSTSTPATEVITEIETTTEMSIGQTIESEIATVPDFSLSTPPGNHCRRYTDETTMDYLDYYLFVPEDAVKDMPLVIFLHGDGEVNNVSILENFGLIARAREIYGDKFHFIAISPCTREYSWINDRIPETLKGLIDTIVIECDIDPGRIIITGHSRGAIGTWHMVNLYGDYFSAAVPVSCGYAAKLNNDTMSYVPIRAMVGSLEGYVREMQSLSDRINQSGGNVEFIIIEDCSHGESSIKAFTIDTFTWMLEQ